MNMKSLRTTVAAAMGGAVLLAGLLVGASFAFAQDSDEPAPETALDNLFEAVERAASEAAEEADTDTLEEIMANLRDEVAPLVDQIKEKVLDAIDEAIAADAIPEELGADLREMVESFELPESLDLPQGFRFPTHEIPFGDFEIDGDCFRFRLDPNGAEFDEECPDLLEGVPFGPRGFEIPDGFPFGPRGFNAEPFEFFGEELDEFLNDLDLEELRNRLESGMDLDEALEDLDLESMLADALEEASARLDELVEDGTLSEERADWLRGMLERIEARSGFPFGLHGWDLDSLDLEGLEFDFGDLEGFGFDWLPRHRFFEEDQADDALLDV